MYFAIVDDIEADRELLKELIVEDCAAHDLDAEFLLYESGEAFLEEYREGVFNAVFLDVLMGGISGIETAEKIRESEKRLPIIITTTEPDFAVDSFAVHVMDFLVKPVDKKRLAWCLEELREYAAVPAYVEVREISGRGSSRQKRIDLDEILFAQSEGHNVMIRTVSGDVRIRAAFQEFLPLLPGSGRFFECSRGLVVNLSQVKRVDERSGGLLLKNGESLSCALRLQGAARQAFMDYAFSRTRKGGWR